MADSIESLAAKAANLQLDSASPARRSPGLRLQIRNPFASDDAYGEEEAEEKEDMANDTASQLADVPLTGRVAAAPSIPPAARYSGRTMAERREFIRQYETYLAAVNALQTQWTAMVAMPVGACISMTTKRLIARYEFAMPVDQATEAQWQGYSLENRKPTFVDYTTVVESMKNLRMKTSWPEPESRLENLLGDMKDILSKFNLTDVAFANEQRRLVKYLTAALEPAGFRGVIETKLYLQERKALRGDVVKFTRFVKGQLTEFMAWEKAAQAANRGTPGPSGNASSTATSSLSTGTCSTASTSTSRRGSTTATATATTRRRARRSSSAAAAA